MKIKEFRQNFLFAKLYTRLVNFCPSRKLIIHGKGGAPMFKTRPKSRRCVTKTSDPSHWFIPKITLRAIEFKFVGNSLKPALLASPSASFVALCAMAPSERGGKPAKAPGPAPSARSGGGRSAARSAAAQQADQSVAEQLKVRATQAIAKPPISF